MGEVLGFGLMFLFGLVNLLWPRGWWRIAEGWKYRNPEAVAPSDAAITVQRGAGLVLCMAAVIIPAWSASVRHEAKEEEKQEQAVAEVKATNRELADTYRQTVVDEAQRLGTSPRQLPVAVLEPPGIDGLTAVRRPDFASTGDVAIRVSGENWCATFPDKAGFPGTVDERPCGYERNLINRFAQDVMLKYRQAGTLPNLATVKHMGLSGQPLLSVLAGRDPRTFTVRLDPVYGGGWCVTFPGTSAGSPTIKPGDCPYPLPQ